jgi:hypothetical protein
MSIKTEIERISGARDAAFAALTEKGVTVPSGTKVDGLAGLIASIPKNQKRFTVTVPTAVATQDVKLVSGDPDVAAHYADATAVCTVQKVSNNNTNGITCIMGVNHSFAGRYGVYAAYNASGDTASALTCNLPLGSDLNPNEDIGVRCTSNGDIIVRAFRLASNFGGADYIIEFSW